MPFKYPNISSELSISFTFSQTCFAFNSLLFMIMLFITGIDVVLMENSFSPIPINNKVANGSEAISPVKVNNSGGAIPNGEFIRRFTYTTSFTNASKAQVDAAVAKEFGGADSPFKALWWDVN